MLGVCKWFNPKKGFGFLTYHEGGKDKDVFVHRSELPGEGFRSLVEGEEVTFDIESGVSGLIRAVRVRRAYDIP